MACGSSEAARDAEVTRARERAAALPPGARALPQRPLLADDLALGPADTQSSLRLVVRDTATWRAVWQRLAADSTAVPATVDFEREQVLVMVAGLRGSADGTVRIAATYSHGDSLVAVVWTQPLGAGCSLGDAMTRPRHLVAVPRDARPVYWRDVAGRGPACF